MQPLAYSQPLERSSAKRSRQHSDTSALHSFSPGTDYYSVATHAQSLHAADALAYERGGMIALPGQGVTHFQHGTHSQSDNFALHGQQHPDVQPLRPPGGNKRPYAEGNTISAFDAEKSAQKLAYQALLERLPVNPTQRTIMCAFLRDELREILRFNRLSYHKRGADNKVSPQMNMAPAHTLLRLSIYVSEPAAQRPSLAPQ